MKYLSMLSLLLLPALASAQDRFADSLKQKLKLVKTDSARFSILYDLEDDNQEKNGPASLGYAEQAAQIALKNGKKLDYADMLAVKGYILAHLGKLAQSFEYLEEVKKLAEDPDNEHKYWKLNKRPHSNSDRLLVLANVHLLKGLTIGSGGNFAQEIAEYRLSEKIAIPNNDQVGIGIANMNIGSWYIVHPSLKRKDSAFIAEQKAERAFIKANYFKLMGFVYDDLASIYEQQGNSQAMMDYSRRGLAFAFKERTLTVAQDIYADLADYFLEKGQADSSLYYTQNNLKLLRSMSSTSFARAYDRLYKAYALKHQIDSAYKYQGLALSALNSTYKSVLKSQGDFQQTSFKDQLQLRDLEKANAETQTRIRTAIFLSAISVLLLLAFIFYRNNRQKQRANQLLSEQKEEIAAQRDNLGQALEELKNTQTQLVQREKMASLGELTAGIAHEIQNPLNFVNNFSEVSAEMMTELKDELQKGDLEEALVIMADIEQNLGKIYHHGRRADSIVKGMLEHSRTSTGQREPTDLNKLADEYLRLAYHGLRAKDKNFNAELVTHYDDKISEVNVVAQDIGRVLLNIINNAFYATQQKAKTAGSNYKPTVIVNTKRLDNMVIISIVDNGTGIPESIREKIMQPFFTTKPTGEGTGLGLSLSYDIVVKAHGGKIDMVSSPGVGSTFSVFLSIH